MNKTHKKPSYSLNCNGILLNLDTPKVMGILNVTPDSFYDGGRFNATDTALQRVEKMLEDGADIIDVGGMSSRPGAPIIPVEDELKRTIPIIEEIKKHFPDTIISIDTLQSEVAREAILVGAAMINDISAGTIDPKIFEVAAELNSPYVLMHMQGKPKSMQDSPTYENVCLDLIDFFQEKLNRLKKIGINDLIVDVGFGFGKTVEHNYQLLNNLNEFKILNKPILIGVSRKSMIWKVLKTNPEQALNGTTVVHTLALLKGANILRVHDVKEAKECVAILQCYNDFGLWTKIKKAEKVLYI